MNGIATQTAQCGEYHIPQVDRLYSALWNRRELFDSLSDHNRALFTWRENPVEWRGQKASNIVEMIRDESLSYEWILRKFSLRNTLRKCSLRNTLPPSKQFREEHPEPWFSVAGVSGAARRIRERISPTNQPTVNEPTEQGRDASGVQIGHQNESVAERLRPIVQRVSALERKRKEEKPPTPTEVIRDQRIQFSCPRRRKELPDPWSTIWAEYQRAHPMDKTASPDTLQKSHDRNCEKCLKDQK